MILKRVATTLRPKLAALLLLPVCCLPNTGCYSYHVYQTGGPEGRELGNQPSTEWTHKTLHSFAWGLIRQDLPAECQLGSGQRLGIEEVKIETNLGFVLISAGTLGIWVPVRVGYRCAKPPVPTDILR
jgi:hypothetical protein